MKTEDEATHTQHVTINLTNPSGINTRTIAGSIEAIIDTPKMVP